MASRSVYAQVADLHAASIDQGFLVQLGGSFLALLYEAIDRDPTSVLITRWENGRVVGFVSGGVGLGPIYRRLLRRAPALACALLPVVVSPRKVQRILEIFRHSRKEQARSLPRSELFSIAVSPEMGGTGCAARLYSDICTAFEDRGISSFKFVVGDSLVPAQKFYRKMGAEAVGQVKVHGGATSTVFVQHIDRMGTDW